LIGVAALGIAARSGTARLVIIMIGVGGTCWTLQREVFSTAVRGQVAAIAAMVDWLGTSTVSGCTGVSDGSLFIDS